VTLSNVNYKAKLAKGWKHWLDLL